MDRISKPKGTSRKGRPPKAKSLRDYVRRIKTRTVNETDTKELGLLGDLSKPPQRKETQGVVLSLLHEAIQHPKTTTDISNRREIIRVIRKAALASLDIAAWIRIDEGNGLARSLNLRTPDMIRTEAALSKAFHGFEKAMIQLSKSILPIPYKNFCTWYEWDFAGLAVALTTFALVRESGLPEPSKHGRKDAVLVAFENARVYFDSEHRLLKAYGEIFFEERARKVEIEKLRNRLKELEKRRGRTPTTARITKNK